MLAPPERAYAVSTFIYGVGIAVCAYHHRHNSWPALAGDVEHTLAFGQGGLPIGHEAAFNSDVSLCERL